MSRVDDLKALHAAELAVVEAEEALAEAKASPDDVPREVKDQLREARRAFRTLTAGEGTANPEPVEAKVEG